MMMNKPSEFHHALVRAVKQKTNQSQPPMVRARAATPKIDGRNVEMAGDVI